MNTVSHIKGSKLSDIMLVYHNGLTHKAVSCKVFDKNMTIYDDPLTIVFCKTTGTFIVYNGKYEFIDDILLGNSSIKFDHMIGKTLDSNNIIQKHNIQVMRLTDLITMYPDVKFIDLPNKLTKCSLSNNFVYGIEYISSKTGKYKHAILINKEYGTKNNINKNFIRYFNKMNDKLKSKSSILVITCQDSWLKYYPNSKIIKIQRQNQ